MTFLPPWNGGRAGGGAVRTAAAPFGELDLVPDVAPSEFGSEGWRPGPGRAGGATAAVHLRGPAKEGSALCKQTIM